MPYLPTAKIVARLLQKHASVSRCWKAAVQADEDIYLCPAMEFSLRRALIIHQAHKHLAFLEQLVSQYTRPPLVMNDWIYASQIWATAYAEGLVLTDVDTLMIAQATRLGAVLVTSDPVRLSSLQILQVNWEQVEFK